MFQNKASLYREFYFYLKRNKYYKRLPNAERTNIFILIDDEWRFHDVLFLFLTFGRFCQVLTRMFLTDIRKMREVLPRIYDPLRVHGKRHPLKTAILKRTSDWNVKCNRTVGRLCCSYLLSSLSTKPWSESLKSPRGFGELYFITRTTWPRARAHSCN